jgi:hypothetical protein
MVRHLASKASTGSNSTSRGRGHDVGDRVGRVGRHKGGPMTVAGALLLTFNVAILFAIPLFGDNPYARD